MAKTTAIRKTEAQGATPTTRQGARDQNARAGEISIGEADDILHAEVVSYICEMNMEMSRMARASGHHLQSYLLEMATAEARSAADKAAGQAFGESEHPLLKA